MTGSQASTFGVGAGVAVGAGEVATGSGCVGSGVGVVGCGCTGAGAVVVVAVGGVRCGLGAVGRVVVDVVDVEVVRDRVAPFGAVVSVVELRVVGCGFRGRLVRVRVVGSRWLVADVGGCARSMSAASGSVKDIGESGRDGADFVSGRIEVAQMMIAISATATSA